MMECDNCDKRAKYCIKDTMLVYEIDEAGDYELMDGYLETAGEHTDINVCQDHYEEYWHMEGKEV